MSPSMKIFLLALLANSSYKWRGAVEVLMDGESGSQHT